ncbi:MAG: DUF3298 and DUF4163 domain-containing protein [Eubacteriales bacterium]|nr:DUF3298 and DUF4163 domain-containing protein [Eubacteriales bacterium]
MLENYVTVNKHTLQGEMFKSTEKLLNYKIEYPQFRNTCYCKGLNGINNYYRQRTLEMQIIFETRMYQQALLQYKESIIRDFPFHVHEAYALYNITYNQDCVISIYSDMYTFTGGAHGSTLRESETWNIRTGDRIYLTHIIENPDYAIKMVCKQIATQISHGENWYFDNYAQLVAENFNPANFYLSSEGPVIYYQQYDIAPYASGILEFVLPWNENIKKPRCCRV